MGDKQPMCVCGHDRDRHYWPGFGNDAKVCQPRYEWCSCSVFEDRRHRDSRRIGDRRTAEQRQGERRRGGDE